MRQENACNPITRGVPQGVTKTQTPKTQTPSSGRCYTLGRIMRLNELGQTFVIRPVIRL